MFHVHTGHLPLLKGKVKSLRQEYLIAGIDDLLKDSEPMLYIFKWWFCLNMSPDEVEKIVGFREINDAQTALMLSVSKKSSKYIEGVILSKSMEVLFKAVPPSFYLALIITEPSERNEHHNWCRYFVTICFR